MTTHPGDHLSGDAIGHASDWFQQTLDGVTPVDPGDQIWFTKETGTLIGWIGFIMLLLGTFELLLNAPYFAQLTQQSGVTAHDKRDGKWWLVFALATTIPVITFYLPYNVTASVLPRIFSTQAAVWALVNGILVTIIGLFIRGRNVTFDLKIWPSVLISLAMVGVGMVALLLADYLFQVDFRFWFVGLKPLAASRFWYAALYFIQFIPILFIAGRIGTFTSRRTASWRPGAPISALFVSWYVVAGQANLYPLQ